MSRLASPMQHTLNPSDVSPTLMSHTHSGAFIMANERGKDLNEDPITGEPGSHPVGTGLGAAGGAAAGAALGTAVGGPSVRWWAASSVPSPAAWPARTWPRT